jgi:excisionase family DNA binding protein
MVDDTRTQAVTHKGGKRLLTILQAAELLGLQPATLRFWVWTRKIPYVKVGRAVRISEAAIEQLIERGTVPAEAR